jgi:hypothetical protein
METPTREQVLSNYFDKTFQQLIEIESLPEKETPRRRGSNKRQEDKFLQTVSIELKVPFYYSDLSKLSRMHMKKR